MVKVTEKNRSLVFLGAILIIGLIAMGVIMMGDTDGVPPKKISDEPAKVVNFEDFKQKIEALRNENFNPGSFNTLSTEIDSYYDQDQLTKDAQIALKSILINVYSDIIYNRCELFLTGYNLNISSELLKWLNFLENITAKNNKIDYYRGQINAYVYYSTTLPKKVSEFISPGIINYNEQKYYSYKDEVNNMPNFAAKYKNNQKFITIRKNLIYNLEVFDADFTTTGRDSQQQLKMKL